MNMTIKAIGLSITAAALWITGTFGELFYILAALLIADAILNYANESAYLNKLMVYIVSSGGAIYIQNANSSGIVIAKSLIVVLSVHELTQVTTSFKAWFDTYKASHPTIPVDAVAVDSNVDQIAALVLKKIQEQGVKEGVNGE